MAYERKTDNPKMGRRKKIIVWEEFEKLCAMQCTEDEVCAWFSMCKESLNNKCKEYYGRTFWDIFKELRCDGFISLRRSMFQKAVKDGNVQMQIHLSKNYLGMSDKQEINTGEGKFTFNIVEDKGE